MSGMDFFGHQAQAQAATRKLVILFVIAVLAIIGCIYAAATTVFVIAERGSAWQPEILLFVTLGTLLIVGLAMAFKTAQLRSGGGKVAELLGGRLVPPETTDPQERMLRNLVEEMAIASGVPVPQIYVLDQEEGINAFAAGWSPADAAIAVTRGCLERFDRDELQGVIAHEFSHVFHGDMRLNIRLMGVLFGIVCIATIGRILVQVIGRSGARSSNNKGAGGAVALVLFGVALIVIGYLGVLFARLIQAAVSRQREYLADASAVQYTRNPRGIGMALAKIGGLGGQLHSAHTEEASHMLFADGMKRYFGGGFATHPAIEERVERVLPGFKRHLAKDPSMESAVAAIAPPVGAAGFAGASAMAGPARTIDAGTLVRSAGEPTSASVDSARTLLRDLPLDLTAAAHDPQRAPALVLALLLDHHPARRKSQLAPLAQQDAALAHEASVLFQARMQTSRRAMLPLLGMAVPALRSLPSPTRAQLRASARALALADEVLSPFEFALLRTLDRHVRLAGELPQRPPGRPDSLADHLTDATVVLSALARVGADDGSSDHEVAATRAFAQGMLALGMAGAAQLLPRERCSLVELERATEALGSVSPLGKRNLLAACAAATGADGRLSPDEADLLRALAEGWDCPIPLVTTPEGTAAAEVVTD
ncbi:MAG: M48 family metallopeptidase [Planctomycetes bacterium]|nr:M48 family metallopeptidase [Planctomycetota bacterium]